MCINLGGALPFNTPLGTAAHWEGCVGRCGSKVRTVHPCPKGNPCTRAPSPQTHCLLPLLLPAIRQQTDGSFRGVDPPFLRVWRHEDGQCCLPVQNGSLLLFFLFFYPGCLDKAYPPSGLGHPWQLSILRRPHDRAHPIIADSELLGIVAILRTHGFDEWDAPPSCSCFGL